MATSLALSPQSLSGLIRAATSQAKAAITKTDALFAAAPIPFAPDPGASAGQLIIARSLAGNVFPLQEVRRIRRTLSAGLKAATSMLDEAGTTIYEFGVVSRYLREGRGSLDGTPADLAFAARQVKAGSRAGIADAVAIADRIDSDLKEARAHLHQERLHLRALISTALLASVNQGGEYLSRCPGWEFMAFAYQQRAARLKAARIRRNQLSKAAKRRLQGAR